MYRLKQLPEDFKVYEVSTVKPSPEKMGYSYWKLRKQEYTTPRAAYVIAAALHIPLKYIGYAGNKDKIAITEQNISIKNCTKERGEGIELKSIELEFLGYGKKPISLGELEGNKFEITARNIETAPKKMEKFLNLFGEQRFSTNNAEVGRSIVKREFQEAVEMILEKTGEQEEKVRTFLEGHPKDYVGAIRQIPKKILKIYVHSYQSRLWNETVIEYSKRGITKEKVPMIGFEINYKDDVISDIMKKEGLSERDFVIREIPELSSEGGERDMYCEIKGMDIGDLEEDELNPGMKKILLKFELGKGSYATECIKAMFS